MDDLVLIFTMWNFEVPEKDGVSGGIPGGYGPEGNAGGKKQVLYMCLKEGQNVAAAGFFGAFFTKGPKGGGAKIPRFEGPKPKYHVNDAHVPGRGLRPGKTPLPSDAEDVFSGAVPNDPINPTAWFGKNADGRIYRFSLGNDGTAHFSGIHGVGDGTRSITPYAVERLGAR